MAEHTPKAFACARCGIFLGESYRERDSKITQLRIYRNPRHAFEGLGCNNDPALPNAWLYQADRISDAVIICPVCGQRNPWYANQSTIEALVRRTADNSDGRKAGRIDAAIALLRAERKRQDEKWGADRMMPAEAWLPILTEETGEVARAMLEQTPVRDELVQVAAVALAWIECVLREEDSRG